MPREKDEAEKRLQRILSGAFAGSPTPLKEIPTRNGGTRLIGKNKPQRRLVRQRKKRAA